MSASFFEAELTGTEQQLRQANRVLDTATVSQTGILARVHLARQQMEQIKASCIEKAHGVLPNAEGPTILPDYDDLRKGIRRKILKMPIVEVLEGNLNAKSIDGSSKSPLGPIKPQGLGKSRFSVVKDLSGNAALSSKKKVRHKADPAAAKPSAFGSMKKHSVYNEDAKIRNSLMIKGFEGKSKLGGQNTSDAPRDSIDVTNHEDKGMAALQRPSTLVDMRNSLFKFDTAVVTADSIREPDVQIDDVLSDLSDCDLEIELVDMEELNEDPDSEESSANVLTLQILQTDNTFLNTSSRYAQNAAAQFEFDEESENNKFAQRLKLQDAPDSLDQRVCIMALNGELLKDPPVYKSVDEGDDKGMCLHKKRIQTESSESVIKVERLVLNSLRTHDVKHLEEAKRIANSTIGVLYGDGSSEDVKVSIKANHSAVYAFKPHAKYVESNFQLEDVLSITQNDGQLKLETSDISVLLGYELSRERKSIALKTGDEFFFNGVDGICIDGILPAGWSDQDYEAFKPCSRYWDLECLNRPINDSSIFKYFLLADLKNSVDGKEIEMLDKAVRDCFDSTKNLARMMKIKKEYLLKIARKEKPALLKLSVVRKYEELGLKKKISEVVVFYAQPAAGTQDGSGKNSLKDKLKAQFLSKSNILRLGKSAQSLLPRIRNESERSNILYSIDMDFDLELGFSTAANKFFLQINEGNQPPQEEHVEPAELVELGPESYPGLMRDKFTEGYSADKPREGLWLPLPRNSQVQVPNEALLSYCGTVARLHSQKALLI